MTHLKLQYSKFKKFIFRSLFWRAPTQRDTSKFLTFSCNLKGEQNCGCLFCYFYFASKYEASKSRSPCFLLKKKKNLKKKPKQNPKWIIVHTVLERWIFCFSSYKNCELKVKLWLVRACEKKTIVFVTFILSEEIFFSICLISMYE